MKTLYFVLLYCLISPVAIAQCDFTINISAGHPQCFGTSNGIVTATATGNNLSGATMTITDINGTNVYIPGTPTLNSLPAGWYFISVTDNLGCTLTDSVELIEPPQIEVVLNITHPECGADPTGIVYIDTVLNAQGDYNNIHYGLAPDLNNNSGFMQDSLYGLYYGQYALHITDAIGCAHSFQFELTAPDSLYFDLIGSTPQSDLQAGEVFCSVSGGIPPYNYLWTSLTDFSTSTNPTWITPDGGYYSILITDSMGCTITDTILVGWLNQDELSHTTVSLYPNPVENHMIHIENALGKSLLVFDSSGRIVFNEKITQTTIHLPLTPGLYYYQISNYKTVLSTGQVVIIN